MQVVHFHEGNSGGVVYPAHDSGVVTGWKIGDDRRFGRVRRSVAAVLNILDLVPGDDAANDRMLPVVVRGKQSIALMQFQCRIGEKIRNPMLAKLRTNGTYDHVLWLSPLYDEAANHHLIVSLNKTTSTNIAQNRLKVGVEIVGFHKSDPRRVVYRRRGGSWRGPTHNRGVTTWRQVCDNRRFARVRRSVTAS